MTNFSSILERLSSRAKNALIMAQMASEELKHDHIGTEHLLYGIVSEKSSFAAEILAKTKLSPEVVKAELIFVNSNNTISTWKPLLSENLKQAIVYGAVVASFTVEAFGLDRLRTLQTAEIENRRTEFRKLCHF